MGSSADDAGLPNRKLFAWLRSGTSSAHRQLERRLNLLRSPVTRQRFTWALERFAGFHLSWEPALESLPLFAPLAASRQRLPLLRRDLLCLGMPAAAVDALPRCEQAADLLRTPERAMGSFYVMEGSTLGGAAISRAIGAADWLPETGLHYFSPPQRNVHADWRQLEEWSERTWPESQWAAIVDGASATFMLLSIWMDGDVQG